MYVLTDVLHAKEVCHKVDEPYYKQFTMHTAYRKATKPNPKMQKTRKGFKKKKSISGGKPTKCFRKCFKVGTGRSTVSRTAMAFWVLRKAVS